MQIWAETGKSALPIRNYSQILYQFLMFTQNLKRSLFDECYSSDQSTPFEKAETSLNSLALRNARTFMLLSLGVRFIRDGSFDPGILVREAIYEP